MVSEERLKNWAWYVYALNGPKGEARSYQPDMEDGKSVDEAIRVLPDISRRVLKARYVSYPYQGIYTLAQELNISVSRLEGELEKAKRRLGEQLTKNARMVRAEARALHSKSGQ